jgi:hypothetical protein
MASYSQARKNKEKFRKYRESLDRMARKSVQHDAKAYIVVTRKDKWYRIPSDIVSLPCGCPLVCVCLLTGSGHGGIVGKSRNRSCRQHLATGVHVHRARRVTAFSIGCRGLEIFTRPAGRRGTSRQGFTFIEPVALRPSQLAAAAWRSSRGRQVVEAPIESADLWRYV